MASATWQVSLNGGAFAPIDGGINASPGDAIVMRLASTSGVQSVSARCYGTHAEAVAPSSIEALWTIGGTPRGSEISWTVPSGAGQAYGIEFTVNGGKQGRSPMSAWISRGGIYVLAGNGERLIFAGETTEAGPYGYTERMNNALGGSVGSAVSSVFSRTGAVVAASGDYDASEVTNDSSVSGATVKDALDTLLSGGGGAVNSVFGRTGTVTAAASDYDASQIDNDSSVTGATVKDALNALDAPIVDADVDVAAAIAGTKIAPDFGAQTIKTTGPIIAGESGSGSYIVCDNGSGALATTGQIRGNGAGGFAIMAGTVPVIQMAGGRVLISATNAPIGVHHSVLFEDGVVSANCRLGHRLGASGSPGKALTIEGQDNNHATNKAGDVVLQAGANAGAGPDGTVAIAYQGATERRYFRTVSATKPGVESTDPIPIPNNKVSLFTVTAVARKTGSEGTDYLVSDTGGQVSKTAGSVDWMFGAGDPKTQGDASSWVVTPDVSSGDLIYEVDISADPDLTPTVTFDVLVVVTEIA